MPCRPPERTQKGLKNQSGITLFTIRRGHVIIHHGTWHFHHPARRKMDEWHVHGIYPWAVGCHHPRPFWLHGNIYTLLEHVLTAPSNYGWLLNALPRMISNHNHVSEQPSTCWKNLSLSLPSSDTSTDRHESLNVSDCTGSEEAELRSKVLLPTFYVLKKISFKNRSLNGPDSALPCMCWHNGSTLLEDIGKLVASDMPTWELGWGLSHNNTSPSVETRHITMWLSNLATCSYCYRVPSSATVRPVRGNRGITDPAII